MTAEISITEIQAGLAVAFPELRIAPCGHFNPDMADTPGFWNVEPDAGWSEMSRAALLAWLSARGWTTWRLNDTVFFMQPLSAYSEEAAARVIATASCASKRMPEQSVESVGKGLARDFPDLRLRALSEFGREYAHRVGFWTGGGEATMPDGESPIFNDLANGCGPYDGPVHLGFIAWLEARGWYYEHDDGLCFLLVPNSYFDIPEPDAPTEGAAP